MRKLADKQHSERATGCFGFGQRNERGDSLVEWETPNNFKIMNTQFDNFRRKQGSDGHGEAPMETLTMNTQTRVDTQMNGTKKDTF